MYWYTVEFGVVREKGGVRAFGAGVLSSYGELEHMMAVRCLCVCAFVCCVRCAVLCVVCCVRLLCCVVRVFVVHAHVVWKKSAPDGGR